MKSIELTTEQVNVNTVNGTAIIVGIDTAEIVQQIGARELLQEMEYSDIMGFVAEAEEEKREIEALSKEDR